MFSRIGWQEIVLILAVLLLLFGAKKIPEIARSLGKSLNEFKKGQQEGASPDSSEADKKDESKPDKPV
jgi:sec-independent protein translocase protein TatA